MAKYILVSLVCLYFPIKCIYSQEVHTEASPSHASRSLHNVSIEYENIASNGKNYSMEFNTTYDEEEEAVNITAYNNMLNDTWLNLVSVMDLYTQREYDNCSAVQALTAAYRYTLKQQKKLKTLPRYLKRPFIVIEGLDQQKRADLAKRLSLHLHANLVPNPPDTFDTVLKHLPENNTLLRNGYFVLNTYIVGLHVRYAVQKGPAIVPGYWLGRAAMSIAKNFPDKPPPFESKFWTWPRDLVKPNIIFYITDRFFMHQFEDAKMVRRYLHVFDNWIDPKCVPLVNTQSIDAMIEEMDPHLQELF